jgi:cell division septation protein DedD
MTISVPCGTGFRGEGEASGDPLSLQRAEAALEPQHLSRIRKDDAQMLDRAAARQPLAEAAAGAQLEAEIVGIVGIGVLRRPPLRRATEHRISGRGEAATTTWFSTSKPAAVAPLTTAAAGGEAADAASAASPVARAGARRSLRLVHIAFPKWRTGMLAVLPTEANAIKRPQGGMPWSVV